MGSLGQGITILKNIIYTLLFLLISTVNLFAQYDPNMYYMGGMKIWQKEKGKTVTYSFENKNFVYVVDDSLVVSPSKYKYAVHFNDIKKMDFVHSGVNWGVVGIFSFVGFIGGALVGGFVVGGSGGRQVSFSQRLSIGILGGVVFGLVGSAISLAVPHDNEYDFTEYRFDEKKKFILEALDANKK